MAQPETAPEMSIAPTVLRGLAALGPIDLRRPDFTLELGLSLWLHRCDASLDEGLEALLVIRDALLDAAGMDRETEPIPLLGRPPKDDIVSLAGYVSHLIPRAALAAKGDLRALVEAAIGKMAPLNPRQLRPSRAAG
jgi:hypothetical protein